MLITIVTYNPDEEFVTEMVSKIKEKSKDYKILIIDNHSRKPLEKLKSTDYFIQFDKNYGLGKAYNYAAKFAKEIGEEYLMFLDQDTVILDNFNPNKVVKEAEELKAKGIDPQILSINIDNTAIEKKISDSNFYNAKIIVNSGMIVRIDYIGKNPFLENLFLDRLDLEYTYRARRQGVLPLVYKERMILHKPGEGLRQFSRFCGKLFLTALYTLYTLRHKNNKNKKFEYYSYYSSFLRYYLMLRNDVYLWIRRRIYPNFWKIIIGDLFVLCEVLGYSKGFKWALRAIRYGIIGDLDKDNKELFQI
ncbi:glycosyltransferase [Sulfurisphaera tokodaii]|uniref:Glycosyltransferase n=2 Tax=Sulfurisphaera tokodaii TaxID=111955 RepID=Q96Z71_SULTO|nr:glycosyltransferase [Sulfurisphaera tokodaii]BAB67055.1 putative glycosyltransferase [Sulfurisphaera tokodaii str. 7]HII74423.1 glycosyltransferase [Sulfurisphaera tokodaii]